MSKGKKNTSQRFFIDGQEITDPSIIEMLDHERKFPYHSKRIQKGQKRSVPEGFAPVSTDELINLVSKDLGLTPTDNFQALKANRVEKIEKDINKVVESCPFDQHLSDQDLVALRLARLHGELGNIEKWLSNKTPTGKSRRVPVLHQLNIVKYKVYIKDEIERLTSDNSAKEKHHKENVTKKKRIEKMSLFDIWTGVDFNDRESSYQKAIDLLKKDNILASGPFVDESNGKLYWRSSIVGTFQYLAAFIQGCIRAKRIIDSHSSADYQVILGNTFNVTFDPKPFKSIGTRSIDFHYLDPFKPLDRLLTNPRIT